MDNISEKERSHIMSLVKQKDTKPEMIVRSFLHRKGLRYRLHDNKLPGKPDLVFPKYKTVVFVHGCFWHGHDDPKCKLARIPKSRVEFWTQKVKSNYERDIKNIEILRGMGWQVLTIWECELTEPKSLQRLFYDINRVR
jgi:DNA mismatch endonuclease, patch repair protein